MKSRTSIFLFLILSVILIACNKSDIKGKNNSAGNNTTTANDTAINKNFKIEFVELGSVNCIPCKKMQPIMKSIESKYKGLIKVTFHDVWKDQDKLKEYGIDLIPTQVFKDASGKELMRHQGFYAEEEIDKFFQSQGINIPQ
ncbi:MAG: thioredoxin family protein [Ignavibacteriae bacterium]|nr:thioredoxin family protein [Ignavibacteriota bacterium]